MQINELFRFRMWDEIRKKAKFQLFGLFYRTKAHFHSDSMDTSAENSKPF